MVEVTQADREAAAAYWRVSRIGNRETQRRYLSSEADNSFIVQAFASHREAALQAQSGNWQETLNELARLEAENADKEAEIARLREVVRKYGEKSRMAWAPAELQQSIDDAFAKIKDKT